MPSNYPDGVTENDPHFNDSTVEGTEEVVCFNDKAEVYLIHKPRLEEVLRFLNMAKTGTYGLSTATKIIEEMLNEHPVIVDCGFEGEVSTDIDYRSETYDWDCPWCEAHHEGTLTTYEPSYD